MINVSTLEVVSDRLFATQEAAIAAAAELQRRDADEERARINFDEELMVYEERRDDD